MTFDAKQEARMIVGETELYEFTLGGQLVERYTSNRRKITAFGEEWAPLPIRRGALTSKQTTEAGKLRVTMACRPTFVALVAEAGLDAIDLTITRGFGVDYDNDYKVWFVGFLTGLTVTTSELAGTLETVESRFRTAGPSVLHQAGCNQTLYDPSEFGCNLDPAAFLETRNVTAIAEGGRIITVDGSVPSDPDYFGLGRIRRSGAGTPFVMVSQQAGLDLVLHIPLLGLSIGDAVDLLPGCDKREETCRVKFQNKARFVGMPLVPQHSPVVKGF